MVILALDTTTPTGSVALSRDSQLLECRVGDPARTHGERLPGDIITLLEQHEMTPAAVDLYAVCAGPGSFTGLRVGLATVQAFALVHARPVIAVPSLEALAYGAILASSQPEGPVRIGAWMNAHRGEVFAALYDLSETDRNAWKNGLRCPPLTEVVGPLVGTAGVVVEAWCESLQEQAVEVVVEDVDAARAPLTAARGARVALMERAPPIAPIVARIAAMPKNSGTTERPHVIRPIYIRRPDAELARERRQANAKELNR